MARRKRASGGRTEITSSVKALANKTSSDGFKRGGATTYKDGGDVDGDKSMDRADRRARGGRTSAPFSSAHSMSARSGKSSSGHEGE